ncbi:MAG: DEAD/DEAH box helicase [bacterium]
MPTSSFHPITRRWFESRFSAPTDAQARGWPAIAARRDTLIAAPTGSGKTLAAFLASIDRLLRDGLAAPLPDATRVLYVSPLRALSNDIQKNLEGPLEELLALAAEEVLLVPQIRVVVRTGDTPASERQKMLRKPPHILVTTPESLYLVLTGAKSREILRTVDTVIVDEIHALARDKRGSHLALSLERLDVLCDVRPVRIGLSATQAPLAEIARFLTGAGEGAPSAIASTPQGTRAVAPREPVVVDAGHLRELDLAVETPLTELSAVCSHEQWGEIYERMVALIHEHKSTLIFVNTRKLAERVSHQLTQRLGEGAVMSHHGSLSHKIRRETERGLKGGTIKAVVATASLELGIDVGHIDLVCQIGSPRAIATLLQRIGRAGHSLGAIPKGRIFAMTRDDLVECLALVRAVRAGRLDEIVMPVSPLDVLAQQIVAAAACDDWDEDELFALCRRAYPFRALERREFDDVVTVLGDGIASRMGRRGAYLHHDRVGRRIRGRRGARLVAITCGGAIPEIADFRVVIDDEKRTFVGSLNEDFAIESNAGDVFLLGNTSWMIRYVRGGEVVVVDAHGAPPSIPFWLGEAPGRTRELSEEVSRLREEIAERADGERAARRWVETETCATPWAAEQVVRYVAAQKAATGMVPSRRRVLFERFFDEGGGMQLVIHSPFGSRINRAWGLAMRKKFCRTFNFELQASADDDGIVLSLGEGHSFPLEQMFRLVNTRIAESTLVQAVLATPFFTSRWRWDVTRALAVKRFEKGKRVPPQIQRMRAEDLLAAVFPQQTGCLENVIGDIEVPDHPLVRETMRDCLREAMDLDGWCALLGDIEAQRVELIGVDTREPSPFSHQRLNAQPYAFLDDAPLEERRARAITLRRTLADESVRDLAELSPDAIRQVQREAWPLVRDADELHDALLSFVAFPAEEAGEWRAHFEPLRAAGRAALVYVPGAPLLMATAEMWPAIVAVWDGAVAEPPLAVPSGVRSEWTRDAAISAIVRGRLEVSGPIRPSEIVADLALPAGDVRDALLALEAEGFALRGRFTPEAATLPPISSITPADEDGPEWCDRRLLARIHRLTLDGLRRQIEPVAPEAFLRFLARHQHLDGSARLRGEHGLLELVAQFEGFEAPAADWERALFANRMESYDPAWLDALSYSGQVSWCRLRPRRASTSAARPMKSVTRALPITILIREDLAWLLPRDAAAADEAPARATSAPPKANAPSEASPRGRPLGGNARAVLEALEKRGALFGAELASEVSLLPRQLEDAIGELAAAGLVTSDGFAALRALAGTQGPGAPARARGAAPLARLARRRFGRPLASRSPASGGRWSLVRRTALSSDDAGDRVEHWCDVLLRRYGIVFRDLLAREPAAPPWSALVRAYRRMEARGEVRGGRFVARVAGEQYALADAVVRLREASHDTAAGEPLVLAATDPLNVFGRILPGRKVPAVAGHRIAVIGGQLVAVAQGRDVTIVPDSISEETRARVTAALGAR